jgi:hypothetical protein
MIEKQIIKENNIPIAVIIDYSEYIELQTIAEDKFDYFSALKIKMSNKKWTTHNDLKKEIEKL